MKSQHVERLAEKKQPLIQDNRPPRETPDAPNYDEIFATATQPVRVVVYVEVGNMESKQVSYMVQELNKAYNANTRDCYHVVPLRGGNLGTDVVFESEFLATVNELCEVKDGAISLRDGAKEVRVIRTIV